MSKNNKNVRHKEAGNDTVLSVNRDSVFDDLGLFIVRKTVSMSTLSLDDEQKHYLDRVYSAIKDSGFIRKPYVNKSTGKSVSGKKYINVLPAGICDKLSLSHTVDNIQSLCNTFKAVYPDVSTQVNKVDGVDKVRSFSDIKDLYFGVDL